MLSTIQMKSLCSCNIKDTQCCDGCGDNILLLFVLSGVLGQCWLPSDRFLCLRGVHYTLHTGVHRNCAAEGYEVIGGHHLGMFGSHGLCVHFYKQFCYSMGPGKRAC